MGKLRFIFSRKRYAPIAGDEFITTAEQQKAYEARKRIEQGLDAIEASETIVTYDDVEKIVFNEVCRRFESLKNFARSKPHTCTQCGAPLKNGKCEYCGTDYNSAK